MKIAIPTINDLSIKVETSFARAPYYVIYDTETKKYIYLQNIAGNSVGGAGIKASQFLVDQKVDVVIAPQCGENAMEVLTDANIKVYQSASPLIENNITDFLDDKLSLLNEINVDFHRHHHG